MDKFYYVLCDSDGNGQTSNWEVVGPYTPDEVDMKHPYNCAEYQAGNNNGPVYRYTETNCIAGSFKTRKDAYDYIDNYK